MGTEVPTAFDVVDATHTLVEDALAANQVSNPAKYSTPDFGMFGDRQGDEPDISTPSKLDAMLLDFLSNIDDADQWSPLNGIASPMIVAPDQVLVSLTRLVATGQLEESEHGWRDRAGDVNLGNADGIPVELDNGDGDSSQYRAMKLGRTWNGMQSPYFTRAEAQRFFADLDREAVENRGEYRYLYEPHIDSLVVYLTSEDGTPSDTMHEQYRLGEGDLFGPFEGFTFTLVVLPPASPHRQTRKVSGKVAAQMLYLLGDNEQWSVRPDDMGLWATIRSASPDELELLSATYPEQCEAYKHALKHWGLDWLRSLVEAERNLDVVAALGAERAAARAGAMSEPCS